MVRERLSDEVTSKQTSEGSVLACHLGETVQV